MTCRNCGEVLGEGAKFCRHCGMAIENSDCEQECEMKTANEDDTFNSGEFQQVEQGEINTFIPVTTTGEFYEDDEKQDSIILSVTETVNIGPYVFNYNESIETAKRNAVEDLRQQASRNNCCAIVGLRYEFIHFVIDGWVHAHISAYATGIKRK